MSQRFGVGTFRYANEVFPGVVEDDAVMDLRPVFGEHMSSLDILSNWESTFVRLADVVESGLDHPMSLEAVRPLPPVLTPRQVFCAGANYHRHVREIVFSMARDQAADGRSDDELRADAQEVLDARVDSKRPFVFSVPPSAVSGARDDIVLWGPGEQHDWELELGVVISRRARNVPEAKALEYVAGYTIGNDISTRDVMHRPNFPLTDFLMTKGRPTFKPTGPYVVPREFVPDYRALKLTLTVNGDLMQDEGVDDMIYGVEELVSYVSTVAELWPGDLLLTGSPAGNAGHHNNRWLRPGDVVEGVITSLGAHRYRCLAPPMNTQESDEAWPR